MIKRNHNIRIFKTEDEAVTTRDAEGCGGYVFSVEDRDEKCAILFPYDFTPSEIFNHFLVKRLSGMLLS
jgi:hypothetical protein